LHEKPVTTEDSQGRSYFLYDGGKLAVEQDKMGTTQATHVNRGPSIYDPLVYMDRSGTKSYHLLNRLGTTHSLASAAKALTDIWSPWRCANTEWRHRDRQTAQITVTSRRVD
jgi:hypothetical protein